MCVKTSVPSSSQFAFVDQTSPKKKELSIPALDKQIVPHVQSSSNEPDIISPPPLFFTINFRCFTLLCAHHHPINNNFLYFLTFTLDSSTHLQSRPSPPEFSPKIGSPLLTISKSLLTKALKMLSFQFQSIPRKIRLLC